MWSNKREPSGPLGLSLVEVQLVEKIRERIPELTVYGYDDERVVRFLRARRCSLSQAEQMIRKNLDWARSNNLDSLLEWTPPPELKEWFPCWISGVDDYGCPIVILQVGLWDPSTITGMKEDLTHFFILLAEKCLRAFFPHCKEKGYSPQINIIVDCEGLSWKHYLCYDAIQAAVTTLRTFEANYPETLRLAAFVNCPSVLGMFWKLAKPLVSTDTHAKLCFLYEDDRVAWRDFLVQYFPSNRFPQYYGGDSDDEFKISLLDLMEGKVVKRIDENANR